MMPARRTALVVGSYADPHPARRDEFVECLRRNLANPHLDEVHVMVEERAPAFDPDADPLGAFADKLTLVPHGRRLTYQGVFEYANGHLAGRRVIAANADIYFDGTLRHLRMCDLSSTLLCLSRWDVQPDGSSRFFEHDWSQDAWIFETPIRAFPSEFHLGLLGCDNRIAFEARRAGLTLANPGRSIRAHHLHVTNVRRYRWSERLHGDTAPVPATSLPISCACVAFREAMGYTVARFEPGVSSHNNELRPIVSVPASLAGLPFTQVVAGRASPVEIEFRTPGKLYILVGTDWDGFGPLTAALESMGVREPLPRVETSVGPSFDVWSLEREAGDRITLPTQAMLVAADLVTCGTNGRT
jgi:hypothetical protein